MYPSSHNSASLRLLLTDRPGRGFRRRQGLGPRRTMNWQMAPSCRVCACSFRTRLRASTSSRTRASMTLQRVSMLQAPRSCMAGCTVAGSVPEAKHAVGCSIVPFHPPCSSLCPAYTDPNNTMSCTFRACTLSVRRAPLSCVICSSGRLAPVLQCNRAASRAPDTSPLSKCIAACTDRFVHLSSSVLNEP